ncbi:MAG: dihydroorotase [Ignavibacteria bacterium]|nr:dihydroorotase [Ignavibacteria bacterium]
MTIELQSPLDMHVHFRQDAMLRNVAPLTAKHFAGAVVMPNLVSPIDSLERLLWYTDQVKQATEGELFDPYMTLFFRDYTREELVAAKPQIIGIKLYPAGATTNSDRGVSQIHTMFGVLALMEELDIPLLVHGESNGFVMDREKEFQVVYREIASTFPKLRIVMEHITTAEAIGLLDEYSNLYATVTPHHLLLTLDDVVGGLMDPHLFCKPIAKRPEDRQALLTAALNAHPKLMHGSDSAPHPITSKECPGCAAGIFTAPIILSLLAELFEKHNALDKLQSFVSNNAVRIYRLSPPPKTVVLTKSPMVIPANYHGVVPMWAGKTLPWSIADFG